MQAVFVQEGRSIDYTPSGAKAAGAVVVQGKLVGVTTRPIAANELGSLAISGVFKVVKDNSNITAVGTPLYWATSGNPYGGTPGSGCLTTTATGNTFAGWALEIAGTTTGEVLMFLRSANDASSLDLDQLSDVGTVDHTAGDLLIADGAKFECLPLTGAFALAASGALALASATVAADGDSQATAPVVAQGFTLVTAANGTKGVKLPAAAAGKLCIVKNRDSENAVLKVYPNADDAINAIAANTALSMAAKTAAVFVAYDATTWYTIPLLPS